MTIKPVVAPSQKRATADTDKKESHTQVTHNVKVVEPHSTLSQQNVRSSSSIRSSVIDGHEQSPQRRTEVYDDMARLRRSPHKNVRSKRRDQHDHYKRERNEREKLTNITSGVTNKCSSPHVSHNVTSPSVASSRANSPSNVGTSSSDSLASMNAAHVGCQSPKSQTSVAQSESNLETTMEENYSGYNSGDEHFQPKESAITAAEWQRRDKQFAKCMSDRGYILRTVEEDGACLFRAISLQIYGDEEMHDIIRQHTMDYIYKNREYFRHFVTEDINCYIKRKRRKDSHGNHIEIQAMSEIYSRPVEVYCYKPTPINIFNSEQLNNGYAPLRISYQRASHYNAIIDPYNATVGVGLGLAGYKPDMQELEATRLNEQLEIEQTMFEDKLKTTDWEATNEAIEEQIARESYLQWCRDNINKTRAVAPSKAGSTSATVTSAEAASGSKAAASSKYSLKYGSSSSSTVTAAAALGSCNEVASVSNVSMLANNSAALSLQEHGFSTTSKPLSNVTNIMKNESKACDLGFESDDTDMSSTSSLGNASPSSAVRSKRLQRRNASVRGNKKRRRESRACAANKSNNTAASENKTGDSAKHDATVTTEQKKRADTPDAEQQPCTSKQSNTLKKDTDGRPESGNAKKPGSSLYQELLEASYGADGYGQLNENEMLQRAIQLSTQDYIEDRKRKYLYGP